MLDLIVLILTYAFTLRLSESVLFHCPPFTGMQVSFPRQVNKTVLSALHIVSNASVISFSACKLPCINHFIKFVLLQMMDIYLGAKQFKTEDGKTLASLCIK